MDRLVEYDQNKQNAKRKVTRRMTGVDPAVPESTDLELKVLAVIGKDVTDGFGEWLDTAVTAVSVASPSPSTSASSPSTPANVETESEVIPNNLTVNI